MQSFMKFYDYLTVDTRTFNKGEFKVQDNMLVSGSTTQSMRGIVIDIAATHSGRPTRNYGFYFPHKMREGTKTFVEPYQKPVLAHHNEHADPIGRVIAAKYIDTSMGLPGQDALSLELARRLNDARVPFFSQLSLARHFIDTVMVNDPDFPGLGYIQLSLHIPDAEDAQRFIDGVDQTFSVGVSTNKAICSVCLQDWIEEGRCEHIPGKAYKIDEKEVKCVLLTGDLLYDEVSKVNVPADPDAKILTIHRNGVMVDSIAMDLGKIKDYYGAPVSANFYFNDSLGGNMDPQAVLADNVQPDAAEPVVEPAAEVVDNVQQPVVEDAATDVAAPEPATEADELTPEQWAEADAHYDAMIAFGFELSMIDEVMQDKVLTAAERKKMKKGTFCKPAERKYPVADCAHARVAMAYAKKNNESSSVIACIRRKAKSLGCPFDGKDAMESETELDAILSDYLARTTPADTLPAEQVTDAGCSCNCADQLEALRRELQDNHEETQVDEDAYVQTLEEARQTILALSDKLSVVVGKTNEGLAELSLKDLVTKTLEVTDSIDAVKIHAKLNDGMTQQPTEPVQSPVLQEAAPEEQKLTDTVQADGVTESPELVQAKKNYDFVLMNYGEKRADAYLRTLKANGLVPLSFDPLKS